LPHQKSICNLVVASNKNLSKNFEKEGKIILPLFRSGQIEKAEVGKRNGLFGERNSALQTKKCQMLRRAFEGICEMQSKGKTVFPQGELKNDKT
jgi:hypothetical protein